MLPEKSRHEWQTKLKKITNLRSRKKYKETITPKYKACISELTHERFLSNKEDGINGLKLLIKKEEKPSFQLSDWYHLFIEMSFKKIIICIFLIYTCSIFFFGCLYYILNEYFKLNHGRGDNEPCLANVNSFTEAFLLALESQTTIGYGGRSPKSSCAWPAFFLTWQYILNVLSLGHFLAATTDRMSRRKYLSIVEYAKNVVISQRDGKLCLLVRIGNPQMYKYESISVCAKLLITRVTVESEYLPLQEVEIPFDNQEVLFSALPIDYIHHINDESPFYEINPDLLDNAGEVNMELVVIVTGTMSSTGVSYQTKHSYTCSEIKWGHRFEQCIFKKNGVITVDYDKFDGIVQIEKFDPRSYEERQIDERRPSFEFNEKKGSLPRVKINSETTLKSFIDEKRCRENSSRFQISSVDE